MRKILALTLGVFSVMCGAQQTNPQTNFAAAVRAANPSLYLNFNDLTTGFTDKISGMAFRGTVTTTSTSSAGNLPTVTATGGTPRVYLVLPAFSKTGAVQTISIQYFTAPPAGQVVQLLVANNNGSGSFTITSEPATLTLAATTAVQTFTAGTGFSAFNVTAGQVLGIVVPSSATNLGYSTTSGSNLYAITTSTVPAIGTPTTYTLNPGVTIALYATVATTTTSTSGTVTPRQQGFDSTTPNNTSAAFAYNGFNAAPNNTVGAIDWNVPFSLLVHVDRLNWNRTGSLVLMSKGNFGVGTGAWELVLQMVGQSSQLCFYEYGASNVQGACTGTSGDAMPNGFNYDIVVTNNGTGANGVTTGGGASPLNVNAVNLYINGVSEGTPTTVYGTGFGSLAFTVSGGTGYAASTPITITGGGPNCTLIGYQLLATSGVPTGTNAGSAAPNYGCTSVPTVSLTSPTGTGVVITASLNAPTMNAAYPLMVPGQINTNVANGVAGTNSTQGPVYVDEAAIFPRVLTATEIAEIYYQTKFYQGLLTMPATAPVILFDDDGCGDMDNTWALEEAIALHKLGYINLEGVVQENNDTAGGSNLAFNRQELDVAGLNNVPVGLPSDAGNYAGCSTAAINTVNASMLPSVAYPTAAQVYRRVFAANPSTPVSVMIGGELSGLANFMQSAADSISPLTGAQLFARNAANGGVLYSQGGVCTPSALPATTPCAGNIGAQYSSISYADTAYVYANGTAMPMTAVGGTPSPGGPGPLASRTSKDPTYLQMSLLYGTDTRTAWDSLAMSALVTPYFSGGVTVGYTGGTGYAASTLFTSTGGGPNCTVTGYMTASGGVPNGITTLWGAAVPLKDANGVMAGIGYGCTSAPTLTLVSPTGSGVTLTAYATTVCVTPTFTSTSQSSASSACNNQFQSNLSQWALPGGNAQVYQWFLNALVDVPPDGAPKLK